MRRTVTLITVGSALVLASVAWSGAAQLGGKEVGTGGSGARLHTAEALPQVKVDLNWAGTEDLTRLPGISSVLAERIVRHRPYRKLEDVVIRKVLGKKQFARIRELVIIKPPSR
jgi:DNA uptake protein ComE-like DNA-binding protein